MKKPRYDVQDQKLIIFDLDGTLTESKAAIDNEMALLLSNLLNKRLVAILGGGSYTQFQNQLLAHLKLNEQRLKHLYLFPTSGASFYTHKKERFVRTYEHQLSPRELDKIRQAFQNAFMQIGYQNPKSLYGELIENRGTQVTFSALGQEAPLEEKKRWNATSDRRKELQVILQKELPEFAVRLGGLTSIDVTKKGIDKAFGVKQIMESLKIAKDDIIFVGDALYEGGNDFAVKSTGVKTVEVTGPEETKKFIRSILEI